MYQRVRAIGHEHVSAEHTSTLELTSDDWLTPAGDCILGIEASAVPATFDEEFVSACQCHDAAISATIRVDGHEQIIDGSGHSELSFENSRSMVIRTSDYVDDRTIMVESDTAAAGIDREVVTSLEDGAELDCILEVER